MRPTRRMLLGCVTMLLVGILSVASICWLVRRTPCRVLYAAVQLGMSEAQVRPFLPPLHPEAEIGGELTLFDWEGLVHGKHEIVHLEAPMPQTEPALDKSFLFSSWDGHDREEMEPGFCRYRDKKTGRIAISEWQCWRGPDGLAVVFDADGKAVEKAYAIRQGPSWRSRMQEWVQAHWPL